MKKQETKYIDKTVKAGALMSLIGQDKIQRNYEVLNIVKHEHHTSVLAQNLATGVKVDFNLSHLLGVGAFYTPQVKKRKGVKVNA